MPVLCPHCRQPIQLGSQSCFACGASLVVELDATSPEPTCAVHPRLRALAPCSRCGNFACALCFSANPPGEPTCQTCAQREPDGLIAWDQRHQLGLPKAFWKTCVDVMLRPSPTFSTLRPGDTAGSSLLFAFLCSFVGVATTALLYAALFAVIPLDQDSTSQLSQGTMRLIMVGMSASWVLLAPLFNLAATLLSSAVDHLVLRLAGAERNFQVTLRANALSQAPFLLGLIPICSLYIAPFWTLVARVFAYRGLHRLTWGPAVAGALVAPLLSCLLCGGGYVALLWYAFSHARP
jgi:hypothetical protein